MAKRRINQKFLALLGGGVLVIAALGVGALKFRTILFPKHPEKYIAAGRDALAKKDYATARDNFARAAALSHPDAALDVMLGDAINGLTSKDPDNVLGARSLWEQALTVDPGNVDAAQRLIQFWRDQLELHPRAGDRSQIATRLKAAAERMLKTDPQNHFAKANWAQATLETVVDGVKTDAAAQATAAETSLQQLQVEDPADADLPFYRARGYIWLSDEAGRSGDLDAQARFLASAQQVMSDAESAQPDNAGIRYRRGQILLQISTSEMNGAAPSQGEQELFSTAVRELDQARELVAPHDPLYVEIHLFDGRMALNRPDFAPAAPMARGMAPEVNPPTNPPANPPANSPTNLPINSPTGPTQQAASTGAVSPPVGSLSANEQAQPSRVRVVESIYREVLSHQPHDPQTLIALAELLGNFPSRRDEAIALLMPPLVDDNPSPGIKGTRLPFFQYEANLCLLSSEIDVAEATRDPGKRPALLATADALCDRLYGRNPDSLQVLGLKGRLELVHGQMLEATQTLRRALALTDSHDATQKLSRYDLMYNLARACEAAQQTGDAKKLAIAVVASYSHFIPARVMLARLLITEHDFDAAKPHIDFLESVLPAHPELASVVSRMRIATLDPTRDAGKIKAYYDILPERTREQAMDKAAFAQIVKYDDETLRLLSLVHAKSPGDIDAARDLANWYDAHAQKQKAVDVLNEALAANPSDSTLLTLQMQMQRAMQASTQGPSAETTQPVAGDPFNSEWAQVQVDRSYGDRAGVDAHLAAAEKLKPDEPRIWDAIFTRALESANWDRAAVYLEKLAAGNIDHAGGVLYRVRYHLARNEVQRAGELALQLTREKPEFSQSWCVLGQVQKAEGKYQDALGSFRQALDRQTQNVEAIFGMIDCSYAIGNPAQAKHYIDIGGRLAPGNDSFKELALNYELTYGDPQNVIAPRLTALQAAPDNQQAWLNLTTAYVTASRSRAKAQDAVAAADYDHKAGALLQQAIAKWPDVSQFVTFYAKLALEQGDFPTAEQAMLNFAQQPSQKGRPRAATLLGEFYELAGKKDQAVKTLRDYLASPFQPTDRAADVSVEVRLSGLLARLARYDDALAALSANAQDPAIVHQKVEVLIDAGRYADARKALDSVAALAPLSPELLSLKGVAAFDAGDAAEAKSCFDQVIAAQPNNADALTQRAQIALRNVSPDFAGAIADLSHARDLVPQDMGTRLTLAEADNRRGRPEDAIQELESALHVVPTNKLVRLRLIHYYSASKPPRWEDADRVLRDAHQIPSLADDADLLHAEAAIDLGEGETDKADQLIRAAMAKSPGNLAMLHTYYDVLLRSKAYDQLLDNSAQLLASNANSSALWWSYLYRAEARFHGNGDRAGTATELENGLTAATAAKDLGGMTQIIQTYAALLGGDEAIKAAAARAPSDPHWLVLAGSLCQQKSDPDGALHWLELAVAQLDKLAPADQQEVFRLSARAYLSKEPPDPLKGADMYRWLLKRSPDDVDALNDLACILVEPGPAYQPREALDCSEKAYNLMIHAGGDEPMIKDTYGWTLIANNRSEEGLSLVQDALGKRDFPEGHYHLAEGLLKRQPPSSGDAETELTKAMQMLDQDERDGKPVDFALKSHVKEELKRTREALAG